jgi:hypothetical protein
VTVFFSFIGLTLFFAAYSIGGGFLFAYLERDYEEKVNLDAVKVRIDGWMDGWMDG